MPELPDITVCLEALEKRVLNQRLMRVRIASPFLLRTVAPPIQNAEQQRVVALRRLGKRIGLGLENELWLVLHLMIAGRLHWFEPGVKAPGNRTLAAFEFPVGTLTLTEAGTRKRASLHLVQGEVGLRRHDPGGLELLNCTFEEFRASLAMQNQTLKRALTDPRRFSGIGNAYADEILHRARLSPVMLTRKLAAEASEGLFHATRQILTHWIDRLRQETGDCFPEKVTAFRPDMAVHGRFGRACPTCGAKVQRIRYADNETNYCPGCQTGGKLLADRSLSRLLRKDWPRTPEELEELRSSRAGG